MGRLAMQPACWLVQGNVYNKKTYEDLKRQGLI